MSEAFVTLDKVDHAYAGAGSALAVEGLSISVNHGEFAAVVGPSGCGKSTLMKLATGLQFPRAGTVTVAGQKVTAPVKIAGMAFQAPTLLPWRTTLENLLLPLEIVEPHRSEMRRRKTEFAERARNLLTSVGLRDQGEKFPWELSGGMQQRTSLCRALIHEPQLLMLDEPAAGLNPKETDELNELISNLRDEFGVSVLLIEHDMKLVMEISNRIFVVNQGTPLAHGKPDEIRSNPAVIKAYLGES